MSMSKINVGGFKRIQSAICRGCCLLALTLQAQAAPLTAGDPILLPGTQGGFDFIRVDTAANRLLLGHTGNKSFDVFDLGTRKLLKVVPTSVAQDIAVDVKRGQYYVSGNDPSRMVIVDSTKLEITGEVAVPAKVDLIGFNPANGFIYQCNDEAGEVWVIDPVAKKIVTTIKFAGTGMEDLAFDPEHKRLYQAVKGDSTIVVVDPASNKILETWPCAPDKGPHGIAIVPEGNGLLVACAGKLLLFDRSSGKIIATADTAAKVDQMAYDAGLHIAYCASKQGKISVVAVAAGKLTALGDVPDESGTGDIAVDPKTHTVWIAFKKGGESFVQPFTATK
jgi:DNA-binding beta-propeller fold protein YncE